MIIISALQANKAQPQNNKAAIAIIYDIKLALSLANILSKLKMHIA